jgi:hypothetical protein
MAFPYSSRRRPSSPNAQLIREVDEARARLAALEKKLARDAAPPKASTAARVPSIDLERFEVDPAFIEIISAETARKHRVLPLCVSRVFTIAMADPSNQRAIDERRARATAAGPRRGHRPGVRP